MSQKIIKPEVIKVVLLGDSQVGKTSIIKRYEKDIFQPCVLATYGENNIIKNITINEKEYLLQIWDTAGQEKYKSISKLYVKNAKIAILVYDITSRKTLENLKYWYDFIKNDLHKDATLGLAGNKIDLFDEEEVDEKEGEEYAKKWGAHFTLLSAKENKNEIQKFFRELVEKNIETNAESIPEKGKTIKITRESNLDKLFDEGDSCCGNGKKQKEKVIQIAFLGANGVGKTNIIRAIKGKEIKKKYEHTKTTYKEKISYSIKGKKKFYVNLIDTNEDNYIGSEMEIISKNCKVFFLIFDLNNKDSYNELDDLIKKLNIKEEDKKYLYILGNRNNLPEGEVGCVTKEEVENFAKEHKAHYESISIDKIDTLQELIKNTINLF